MQFGLHAINHVVDAGEADPSWVGVFDAVVAGAPAVVLAWLVRGALPRGGARVRVFVAGGTGAIGRPLVDRLLRGRPRGRRS